MRGRATIVSILRLGAVGGALASCIVAQPTPPAPSAPQPVTTAAAPVPAAPVPTASAAPVALEADVRTYVWRDDRRVRVESGGFLGVGEHFEMKVRLHAPAYVYLAQAPSAGAVTMLYPPGAAERFEAREYRFPVDPEIWFEVGGRDRDENVFVVLSRAPLADPRALVARETRADPTVPQAPPKKNKRRPPPDRPAAPPTFRADVEYTERTRHVFASRFSPPGETAPADDAESVLLKQLHFGRSS